MASVRSPLSPHLTIYRWQITMVLSILHRATGVFMSIGLLLLTCWLLSLATGQQAYDNLAVYMHSWYGQAILIAFTFSLYLHLCNGIRHLFWDAGLGFQIPTFHKSGYAVVIATLLLTCVTWLAGGLI